MAIAGSEVDRLRKKQMQDPFYKFFRQALRPDGQTVFVRRFSPGPNNLKDPGVSQEAADRYQGMTGKRYSGPIAKKPTASKSTAKAPAKTSGAKPRPLRTQRSLFGGDVKTLFPSQRRDLTRRRAARRQAERTKKILGT